MRGGGVLLPDRQEKRFLSGGAAHPETRVRQECLDHVQTVVLQGGRKRFLRGFRSGGTTTLTQLLDHRRAAQFGGEHRGGRTAVPGAGVRVRAVLKENIYRLGSVAFDGCHERRPAARVGGGRRYTVCQQSVEQTGSSIIGRPDQRGGRIGVALVSRCAG